MMSAIITYTSEERPVTNAQIGSHCISSIEIQYQTKRFK